MFSKSLFKQSCKANGAMWAIITFATCFMLACVMLIAGGGNLAEAKTAIADTIIQGELTSQMQQRAVNYYMISNEALGHFDETFKAEPRSGRRPPTPMPRPTARRSRRAKAKRRPRPTGRPPRPAPRPPSRMPPR